MNFLDLKSNHPLGAIIEQGKTTFALFAPRADKVTVTFFKNLDNRKPETHELHKINKGVWEVTHNRNLHGWYYYFQVYSLQEKPEEIEEIGSTESAESPDSKDTDSKQPSKKAKARSGKKKTLHGSPPFLDPYALATVGPAGPGIIWDRKKIKKPRGKKFEPPSWHDLVIVEGHVRDLIKHAPIALDDKERRGFTGLEKWVRTKGSYLKSIGVNAVELQPLQEVGDHYAKEDYHWGYMPVNYFAPESSYALHPESGSQIAEFQSLVKALHDQGFTVLLDVVYNHVGNPNPLYFIDKDYYFHQEGGGELTNWSGCGNDVRCEGPMARRLIIDSLLHFMECYEVDGFRFDLAHLIGLETLKAIEAALKAANPSVILIAEPWSFRGHIAQELKDTGFASWNDGYREFVYEYLLGRGNQEGLHYYMGGSTKHLTAWPAQTVNYVESHDDRCWIDKITENPEHRGDRPTAADRRRAHLACAIIMSSLGIPMISAGQDGLRTKQGIDNSYREADINAVDYQRIIEYASTHDYFRKWIGFRRSERGQLFRLEKTPQDGFFWYFGAEHDSSATAIQYNADKSHGDNSLLFAVNPHPITAHIHIAGPDLNQWKQIADHERFEEKGLTTMRFRFEHGILVLPPMSCGLWEE